MTDSQSITADAALYQAKGRAGRICRQCTTLGVACRMVAELDAAKPIAEEIGMVQGLIAELQEDTQEHYDALVIACGPEALPAND